MELVKLLRSNELFAGLNDAQFEKLAGIFQEMTYNKGDMVFAQGDSGDRLYLVRTGFVEVAAQNEGADSGSRPLVHLGSGQSVGEIALIDQGPRSATVRSVEDGTVMAYVGREAFEKLCDSDTAIGYRVMRNIAADLSFKLRHQTLRR